MKENDWYLYRHLKPNGEVFYIGIGKTKNFKRAYEKNKRRSEYWRNKVKRYPNFEVQILAKGLTKDLVNELEVFLISWYGREDLGLGTLVNLTDGGDGMLNCAWSEETKDKIRGKNHYSNIRPFSEEHIKNLSISHKGNPAPKGENHYAFGKPRLQVLKDAHSKLIAGANHPNSKIILDVETGIFYDYVGEAAEVFGIKRTTLTGYLNGRYKNKTSLIYV